MGNYLAQWQSYKREAGALIDNLEALEGRMGEFREVERARIREADEVVFQVKEFCKLIQQSSEFPLTLNDQAYRALWGPFVTIVGDFSNMQPGANVDGAVSRLLDPECFSRVWEQFRPVCALAKAEEVRNHCKEIENRLPGDWTKASSDAREFVQELRKQLTMAQSLYDEQKVIAGKAAALPFVKDFNAQAGEHATRSRYALLSIVILSLTITGSVAYLANKAYPTVEKDPAKALTTALTSLTPLTPIFALGLIAVILAMKVFIAERHLYVVNRQKELAASTFASFVQQAGDEKVRDAVLQHTVGSIFTLGGTGYSKIPLEVPQSPLTNIVALTKD